MLRSWRLKAKEILGGLNGPLSRSGESAASVAASFKTGLYRYDALLEACSIFDLSGSQGLAMTGSIMKVSEIHANKNPLSLQIANLNSANTEMAK